MSESTGGHWLDTGEGLVSLDPAPEEATPARKVSPQQQAWTAYQDHKDGCSQCRNSLYRCADGNELWDAYAKSPR